jgi:hypothetical protein
LIAASDGDVNWITLVERRKRCIFWDSKIQQIFSIAMRDSVAISVNIQCTSRGKKRILGSAFLPLGFRNKYLNSLCVLIELINREHISILEAL